MRSQEYRRTLAQIKHAILATDVATHLRLVPAFKQLTCNLPLDHNDPNVKKLTYSLCMTACDLSDSTKDWATITSTSVTMLSPFIIGTVELETN